MSLLAHWLKYMQKLPVKRLVMPSCLLKKPNGKLDPDILVTFGMANFTLVSPAARSMRALMHAASVAGFTVWTTGTYRSYDAQVALFVARHTHVKVPGATVKLWDKKLWWLRKGMANAARPGTSNHGFGLACDFALKDKRGKVVSVSHDFVKWMCVNAATYGWSAEIQSENWHWRYVAGDNTPKSVLDFEANV